MKKLLGTVRKAIDDYKMISEKDKIAIGISGGKDSMAMLDALYAIKSFYPEKFDICAITISIGFEDMNYDLIKKYLSEKNIEYKIVKTGIKEIVFDKSEIKNPCSLCSRLRRGALIDEAVKSNCNKIALGHHRDDVNTTFLMSLIYEGRINCFCPVTNYEDRNIKIIRPMVYTPEYEIKSYVLKNNVPIVKNMCPADKNTKREEISKITDIIAKNNPAVRDRIFNAVSQSDIYGWRK